MTTMSAVPVVLLFASLTLAQTTAPTPEIVDFRNTTPSDSPVLVTPTAKRVVDPNPNNHGQYICFMKMHTPSLGVVAYSVEFQMNGFDGKSWTLTVPHDHFISGQSISGQKVAPLTGDFYVRFPCDRGKPGSVELKFVQFEDGSTWGESSSQQETMTRRTEAQNYLAQLKQAYVNGGAAALNAKLDQPVGGNLQIVSLQTHLKDERAKNGVDAVPALIDTYMSAINAHAAWLK